MKENIVIVGFVAYSGTGKTTLIEKIIIELKKRNLRIAVIKHDAHDFEIDKEGKDTYRFSKAGADVTVISSPKKAAFMENRPVDFDRIVEDIKDVDLIIVEGYTNEDIPKIGLARKETGKEFKGDIGDFVALVTDYDIKNSRVPVFVPDDIEGIAEFLLKYINSKGECGVTMSNSKTCKEVKDFTHFNDEGKAKMVDVGEKPITVRTAVAKGTVKVNKETFNLIKSGGIKKGDVLTVARIAGIMGAKKTFELIPMCHPIAISGIDMHLSLNEEKCRVDIEAIVSCEGKTGVEMEALTAVNIAALTVYDMCKAVQKDMEISDVRLVRKSGGIHGDIINE